MAVTSIEWCDRVWNCVRGCSMAKGSELKGCLNCYAAAMAARNLPGMRSPTTGEPFARRTKNGPRWTGAVELIPSKLSEPLTWRKPQRVFVNSMSDLFHESLPDEAIGQVFGVMGSAEHHTFQILTKRPERMRDFMARYSAPGGPLGRTLSNVWLGVSCEDQATADERIPLLLQTPAAVRFVSYEPALGSVDFEPFLQYPPTTEGYKMTWGPSEWRGIDWIIVGGESGPGARPFDVEWARSTMRQCKAAGVPVFVKQLGARPTCPTDERDGSEVQPDCSYRPILILKDRKGGDPAEWPEDLRVREFPA